MAVQQGKFFRSQACIFARQPLQGSCRNYPCYFVVRPTTAPFQPGITSAAQFLPVIQPVSLILGNKTREVNSHAPVTSYHGQLDPFPCKTLCYPAIFYQPGKCGIALIRLRLAHRPQFLHFSQDAIGLLQNNLATGTLAAKDRFTNPFGMFYQVRPASFSCQ